MMPNSVPDVLDAAGYRDLSAWQTGMDLASRTHALLADRLTFDHLAQQLVARALDIPTRIAEGYAGGSPAHFLRMISEARSSLAAFDTQLILAFRAGYFRDAVHRELKQILIQLDICLDQLSGHLRSNRAGRFPSVRRLSLVSPDDADR
jgi:four helix bundle protein